MQATLNTSPKAKQFQEELQSLLDKYQYKLNPQLSFTKQGIIPVFSLEDVLPEKGIPLVVEEVKKIKTKKGKK